MANPISFFIGYSVFYADMRDSATVFNLCSKYGIVYRNQKSDEKSIYFECSYLSALRLERECKKIGVTPISIEYKGMPKLLHLYRKRAGIFTGLIISAFLIYLSGTIIWDIRIDGLENLSKDTVVDLLKDCGIYVGISKKGLDTDVIQNKVIIFSDDISWISINLSGTVANVEIRETLPVPEEKAEYDAANLISNSIGIIERFDDVRGEIVVKIGDTVSKGELLVSGIRESKTQGFTYTCAEGKVFARCEHEYEVQIPLNYRQKIYTNNEFNEKYIKFFDKEVKIYANTRKMSSKYDIIEYDKTDTLKMLSLNDTFGLPFGIRNVCYKEYEYTNSVYSAEEVVEIAIAELKNKETELGIEGIISKDLQGEFTDEYYILRCKAVSVQNIAKQVEIEIKKK